MTQEFDYVIVGGGTAGCVLANRLSERPDKRVLLIEAGPRDSHPFIHMPRGIGKVLSDPRHVWPFPVHGGAGANRPPAIWVRGKTLGGSSSVNGMMYVRGQPADFDTLAAETSEDWSWERIAPIYRAMEAHPLGSGDDRGTNGPLKLSFPRPHPLMDRVIESGAALGLDSQRDINRPDDREKIGYCPATISRGRRQSASVAFLDPVRHRPNLTIVTDALADRVVFEGRRAVGIDCRVGGREESFRGKRIILCGGAFGSPAILQRSGIGPATQLASLGIPVLAERAQVGANLAEHCSLAMQWRLKRPESLNPQFSGWRLLLNGMRYYLTRTGALASGAYDVLGWVKSRPGLDRPDVQFIAAPFSIDKSKATLAMEPKPGMQIAVYPLRPRSSGSLVVTSRDPAAMPAAAVDCFAADEDRAAMVGAVRFVRRMMATAPIADHVVGETRPGLEHMSDSEILDMYRQMGGPAYHAAGTCRMGRDAESVVDPMTRVRGAERLHVVDLSIAPVIPAGNTFAPVAALAWRASELIADLDA